MVRNVAVLGAGTMGAQIAAHAANAGLLVLLLDVTLEQARAGLKGLEKSSPAALFVPETIRQIDIGTIDKDLGRLQQADWTIEAIVENLDIKKQLLEKVDKARRPGSLITTNTSGLSITALAAGRTEDFRRHWFGTHFFNPPRYMKLLEVIPTTDTRPDIVAFVREFGERRLGKGVVICKDTPNFIANRIASIGGATLLDFVLQRGYTIEEVDAIAGPLIGRPKTAAFRLQDLVGLDVSSSVARNLYDLIPNDPARDVLRSPRIEALRKRQMDRGRLG